MDYTKNTQLFSEFVPAMREYLRSGVTADAMIDRLTLLREGSLQVVYAPFDHIADDASLVIVGITPGRTQALNAINAAARALAMGESEMSASRTAKLTGSFSGSMRSNLVALLDHIGLAKALGLSSTAVLFTPGKEMVHFTSALRYPVFIGGANYNGSPDFIQTPILRTMIENHLADEARRLAKAIWLPLGPQPARALHYLASRGLLKKEQIIEGLPHPSGANAERIAYFLGRKERSAVSAKTNPTILDQALHRLRAQVSALKL